MNLAHVEQIAKAVLYEGYMLYPYRPSSMKNRQRFNFGVIYPQAYSETQGGVEPAMMQTECLVRGGLDAILDLRLRFLHLYTRFAHSTVQSALAPNDWQEATDWQEAEEREVCLPSFAMETLCRESVAIQFAFAARNATGSTQDSRGPALDAVQQKAIEGNVHVAAARILDDVFKITIQVHNETPLQAPNANRELALMCSLISTHLVLGVENGKFVSLLEPPEELKTIAARCENIGVWPVLVGKPGQRDTLLASPIILYDYPQIAPESVGDLFDGTEIDEILSLRIMTLTDDEKQEIRGSDARARQILERTENMPVEQFMKLHGAARSLRPIHPAIDREDA